MRCLVKMCEYEKDEKKEVVKHLIEEGDLRHAWWRIENEITKPVHVSRRLLPALKILVD